MASKLLNIKTIEYKDQNDLLVRFEITYTAVDAEMSILTEQKAICSLPVRQALKLRQKLDQALSDKDSSE